MKEALQSLLERFNSVRLAWPKAPDSVSHQEQVWYAGLAVSPVEFSRQLASLQVSLQGAVQPVRSSAAVPGPTAIH